MRGKYYALIVVTGLLLAGCNHYGEIPKDYGNSYNMSKSGQILNPAAGKNTQPVTGLAGKAADTTVKKYLETFVPSAQAPQGSQGFAIVPVTPQGSSGMAQDVYGK